MQRSKWKVLMALSMLVVLTMGAVSYADSPTVVRLDWNDEKKVEQAFLDEGLYKLNITSDSRGRGRGSDLEYSITQRDRRGNDRDTIIEGTVKNGDSTELKLRICEKGRYEIGLKSTQGRGGKGEFRVDEVGRRGGGRDGR